MTLGVAISRRGPAGDEGAAVMIALIATVLLGALGLGLLTLTNTEVSIASNYRESAQMLYAAEGAAERAISEIASATSWSDVLSGVTVSAFRDGTLTPTLPSRERLDLTAMTVAWQAASDASAKRGANNPRWRLFLYCPFSRLVRSIRTSEYVIVWVADDAAESDDDPFADANRILMLRAQAVGRQGMQRTVEVALARRLFGAEILSWREVR